MALFDRTGATGCVGCAAGAVTVTTAVAVSVTPSFERAVRTYVVVVGGETATLPAVWRKMPGCGVMVACTAFRRFQFSVAEPPGPIVLGVASKEISGRTGAAGGGGATG